MHANHPKTLAELNIWTNIPTQRIREPYVTQASQTSDSRTNTVECTVANNRATQQNTTEHSSVRSYSKYTEKTYFAARNKWKNVTLPVSRSSRVTKAFSCLDVQQTSWTCSFVHYDTQHHNFREGEKKTEGVGDAMSQAVNVNDQKVIPGSRFRKPLLRLLGRQNNAEEHKSWGTIEVKEPQNPQ